MRRDCQPCGYTWRSVGVYYEESGSGEPLVLLHAAVADCRQWDANAGAFASRYRVIRYDMQGFGKTPAAEQPRRRADELRELLETINVSRAHLVGVSNGGSAAIDFAVLYPEMVGALVAVAPGLSGFEPRNKAALDAMLEADQREEEAVARGDLEAATWLSMGTWLAGHGRNLESIDPELRERVAEMTRAALESSSHLRRTPQLEPGAASQLANLRVPTLVLVGEHEVPFVKDIVDVVASSIPGAQTYVFPNAAHWLNLEHPEEFNRVVGDFLAAHPI
jgi:pimeloyl-ACP methyl ester carboxylesterase